MVLGHKVAAPATRQDFVNGDSGGSTYAKRPRPRRMRRDTPLPKLHIPGSRHVTPGMPEIPPHHPTSSTRVGPGRARRAEKAEIPGGQRMRNDRGVEGCGGTPPHPTSTYPGSRRVTPGMPDPSTSSDIIRQGWFGEGQASGESGDSRGSTYAKRPRPRRMRRDTPPPKLHIPGIPPCFPRNARDPSTSSDIIRQGWFGGGPGERRKRRFRGVIMSLFLCSFSFSFPLQ